MDGFGILSLVPAAVTIVIALSTRKVALALFAGILGGALVLATGFMSYLELFWKYMLVSFTDPERLKIVAFIMLIGGLLEVISHSGAYARLADALSAKLTNARRSRLATWLLSFTLFFDDYANVLISGASMRNTNLRMKVSPAMLAYIVDVVAIMASVMIVSTWAAYEGSVMQDAGRGIGQHRSLSEFFLASFPYHFYTFLAIFMAFVVAFSGRWFGYKLDKDALPKPSPSPPSGHGVKLYHVLAPILTLLGFAIASLFIGGYFTAKSQGLEINLMNVLGAVSSIDILIVSTFLAMGVAFVLLKKDKIMPVKTMGKVFGHGVKEMVAVSLVILFATGLAAVSEDLGTGVYIADILGDMIHGDILLLIIFALSALITVATGFSWSSMAIVMPIAYQMTVTEGMGDFLPAVSAAVISGAVSGEHMIPFSEKAVMSAAACKISPVYHVKTMIFQTFSVFIAGGLGFYLYGLGTGLLLSYLIPAALLLILHFSMARVNKNVAAS